MSHRNIADREKYQQAYRERNKARLSELAQARYQKNRASVRAAAKVRWANMDPEKKAARLRAQKPEDPTKKRDRYRKQINRELWKCARKRSMARGLPFDITPEDIVIPALCPVLGIPLLVGGGTGFHNSSPSLDRTDNARGYVKGNVQVISLRANRIKCDSTVDEMRKLLAYMEKITA